MVTNAQPLPRSIWESGLFTLTLGSILAATIVAFQGLAVSTIAPVIADDLGGESLYGWIFTAAILSQICGTVLAGFEVDRRRPVVVFYAAVILFGVGCLISGFAVNFWVFLVGRALQGFGAGATFATVYAVVGGVYADRLRPSMFAAISSAWIIPSLIGPFLAGWVADTWSWRTVFHALVIGIILIAPLCWPSYRHIELTRDPDAARLGRRVPMALALALGTGAFLAGPDLDPLAIAAIVTMAGLAIMGPMLLRLLPPGTVTASTALGAPIAVRGLLFGAFAVTESYMVYSLNEFGGASPKTAGIMITLGSLTWSAGSLLQARMDTAQGPAGRPGRIRLGVALMLVGIGSVFLSLVILRDVWLLSCAVGWMVAGLGIGLGYTTSATLAFANAPSGQDGLVSSSTLLGDLMTSSIGVGIGGILLAGVQSAGGGKPIAASAAMTLALIMLIAAGIASTRLCATHGTA